MTDGKNAFDQTVNRSIKNMIDHQDFNNTKR